MTFLLIFVFLLFSLLVTTSFAQSTTFTSSDSLVNCNVAYQENTINLNKQELKYPLSLKITANDNTRLSGKVLTGKLTFILLTNNLNFDLSSLLLPGKNIITIIGNYTPINNSVSIKLQGKTTNISTSTQGNGILHQKLIIYVE